MALIVFIVFIVLLVCFALAIVCIGLFENNTNNTDNVKYSSIKHVGGYYGTVANDRESAEKLLYDLLETENDAGSCYYLGNGKLRTLIGICHIGDDGEKQISFVK